jgi:putative peptide zinc metalloprotease protein
MSANTIRLKPQLAFSPVRSRESISYVIEDRTQQKFWRIGELEYEVCSAIDGKASIAEVLFRIQNQSPFGRQASLEKIQKIIVWLTHSGLVEEIKPGTHHPSAAPKIAPPPSSAQAKWFDPSSFKVPLLSEDLLHKLSGRFTWLISVPCLILAMMVWCVAIVMFIQNNTEFVSLGKKLFVPGSQWWWLVAWAVLKLVHETGHAVASARVGSKSKGAGIGFMFFAPMPYVDVSNLWQIENKWSRALVSAAGILFELTFASLALILACNCEHTSIRYLCFTIVTLGTFSTIAFNGNPLMRFDGYYVMVDLIGRPNLWQDASKSVWTFLSSWLFKTKGNQSWSVLLISYGLASFLSRMLVMITMGWGLWMTWDGIGLCVIAFFACLWFVVPRVQRMRMAAMQAKPSSLAHFFREICPRKAIRLGLVACGIGLCSFAPSPMQVYWPAIVDYVQPSDVRTATAGFVEEVFVHDGQGVREGDQILRLSNPTLELDCLSAKSALKSSEEKCASLRAQKKHSELQAEEANYSSLLVKYSILETKVNALVLKATRNGVLLARMSQNLPGSFIPEGQSIGMIVAPAQVEVKASVPQEAWEVMAHNVDSPVSIYLVNGQQIHGKVVETLPRTSDALESPCLGGIYGGPIAVVLSKDEKGEEQLKCESPRLQTRIEIHRARTDALPPPGALCAVKLTKQNERIWETGYRWIKAAIHVQFDVRS